MGNVICKNVYNVLVRMEELIDWSFDHYAEGSITVDRHTASLIIISLTGSKRKLPKQQSFDKQAIRELVCSMSPADLFMHDIYGDFDPGERGYVTCDDLLRVAEWCGMNSNFHNLVPAFQKLDEDGDGRIPHSTFMSLLQ